jgi:hypothetical protein
MRAHRRALPRRAASAELTFVKSCSALTAGLLAPAGSAEAARSGQVGPAEETRRCWSADLEEPRAQMLQTRCEEFSDCALNCVSPPGAWPNAVLVAGCGSQR